MEDNTKTPIYRKLSDDTLVRIEPETISAAVDDGNEKLDVVIDRIETTSAGHTARIEELETQVKDESISSKVLSGLNIPATPEAIEATDTILSALGNLQAQLNKLGCGNLLQSLAQIPGTSPTTNAGIQFGTGTDTHHLRLVGQRYRLGTNSEVTDANGVGITVAPWLSPNHIATTLPNGGYISANTIYRLAINSMTTITLRSNGWQSGESSIIRTKGAFGLLFTPASGITIKLARNFNDQSPQANDVTIYCMTYTGAEFIINKAVYE